MPGRASKRSIGEELEKGLMDGWLCPFFFLSKCNSGFGIFSATHHACMFPFGCEILMIIAGCFFFLAIMTTERVTSEDSPLQSWFSVVGLGPEIQIPSTTGYVLHMFATFLLFLLIEASSTK